MQRCLPLRTQPWGAPEGNGPESYRDYVPPWDVIGEVFGLSDAAVLTPAIAGAASPAVFAGAVAPADLAGTDVPAVAEDLSLADDAGGFPSVIRVSEPLRAVVLIDVGRHPLWLGGGLRPERQ